MSLHPFTKYGEALVRVENDLNSQDDINAKMLQVEIQKGLNSFRLCPAGDYKAKSKVSYTYLREVKGDTKAGVFLAPNIISSDMQARNIWKESHQILGQLEKESLGKIGDVKMSISPISGEFLNFSLTSSIGRGKPKTSLFEVALNAISSLSIEKPYLQYRIERRGGPETANTCIIPDLPLAEMMDFVRLFKRLKMSKSSSDLLIGNVLKTKNGTFEPKRPRIYKGNFPNAPISSALGSLSLLGTIGEFAKEAEVSSLANRVLDRLKFTSIYMIKYGGASTFSYSSHIIELAKEGRLKEIIDSIYYTQLYGQDRRTSQNTEYQKFDLFSSRFLQLFNLPAFKDFLSFRGEYPYQLLTLFNTYFKNIDMIESNIVASARELGRWLNQVAYFTAKREVAKGTSNYWEKIREAKAKVLIELESSTFSAKSGDALIAQAITRAGRLSHSEPPESAGLYMEKTASGELQIDQAKNLLIAFSRLKNEPAKKEESQHEVVIHGAEKLEDLSDV